MKERKKLIRILYMLIIIMSKKRIVIQEWWKTYFICTKCWEKKEATTDFFCKENNSKYWLLSICKSCISERDKAFYSKHREKIIDKVRVWKENNKLHCKEWQEKYREEHKEERNKYNKEYMKLYRERDYVKERIKSHTLEKWYRPIHKKTNMLISKRWWRPGICPICWWWWRIEAHHPNYDKYNEIVWCCKSCHMYIHQGKIINYKIVDLLA